MDRKEMFHEDKTPIKHFAKGYLFLRKEQLLNYAVGLKYPIEVEALKKAFSNSIMVKHPSFCSIVVQDHNNGRLYWKKTHVNLDDHIIIHHHHHPPPATTPEGGQPQPLDDGEKEAGVNAFLAEMANSTQLSRSKPLWELHVLMGLNCVVLRFHHALGDGFSLMAMLLACFGENKSSDELSLIDEGQKHDVKSTSDDHEKKKIVRKNKGNIWGLVKTLWFTLVFGLRFLGKSLLWMKDDKCVISGGDGVEHLSRSLVTAKFKLEDFKSIKKAIPDVTINDVLLGVISSGLSKYLYMKSPDGIDLTAMVTVNLRKGLGLQKMSELLKTESKSSTTLWGNITGGVFQPIHCCNDVHPLEHVRRMKSIMDQKKQSYEAYISFYLVHFITSLFGRKVINWGVDRMFSNITMVISNFMGPANEIAIASNPVSYIRIIPSSPPHGITLYMTSYAGRLDLQVMVAKDIIPDPQLVVKCFEDALLEMKNCATIEKKLN